MPVIILNGNTRVTWASSIANVNLPTAAELNAGTDLVTLLRTDGLSQTVQQEKIGTGNLGTKYVWQRFGTVGYDFKFGFHHDTTADTAWALFPFKTSGFLAIRRGIARTTAWTSGQGTGGPNGTLQVFPLECGMSDETDPPGNWDFELEFVLTGDPADRAQVA